MSAGRIRLLRDGGPDRPFRELSNRCHTILHERTGGRVVVDVSGAVAVFSPAYAPSRVSWSRPSGTR